MEPVTTSAMIGTVVGYLAKKISDNNSFKNFTDEFSSAVVDWIKPIFLREDGSTKDVLADLQKNPTNIPIQEVVKANIHANLANNKDAEKLLAEMVNVIESKKARGEQVFISISGSEKFIVSSPITGNVYFGDETDKKR